MCAILDINQMETLIIKGHHRKQYTITQSGVLVATYTNPKLPTEELIAFENIKNERLFYKSKSPILLIISGVCLMIYILILADSIKNNTNYSPINNFTWPILTVLLIVTYFLLQPKVYLLKTFTGKYIKFKIRDNEQEISDFTKRIIEKRDNYIRIKYGQPNIHLPYDSQFSNFNIMARKNIITSQECQKKIEELNRLFNQTAPVKTYIGYSDN